MCDSSSSATHDTHPLLLLVCAQVVEGVSHRVLPFVGADVGGSPWGCVPGSMGTCADAHAVVHSIDRVIVKQEASPVTSSSSSSSSS